MISSSDPPSPFPILRSPIQVDPCNSASESKPVDSAGASLYISPQTQKQLLLHFLGIHDGFHEPVSVLFLAIKHAWKRETVQIGGIHGKGQHQIFLGYDKSASKRHALQFAVT